MSITRVLTGRTHRFPSGFVASLAILASIAPVIGAARGDNLLWHVVHDLCVPAMKLDGSPTPCSKVDQLHGYVILKDLGNPTQSLLAPTARPAAP